MRTSQKTHDSVVKDSFLIQIGSAQHRVVRLSLVILGKMLLNVVIKITPLGAPNFVLGRDERLVNRAEQHGRQNSNNADDQQQFQQGEPRGRAMISFHTGLDSLQGSGSRYSILKTLRLPRAEQLEKLEQDLEKARRVRGSVDISQDFPGISNRIRPELVT
jgi:hypothetical protein